MKKIVLAVAFLFTNHCLADEQYGFRGAMLGATLAEIKSMPTPISDVATEQDKEIKFICSNDGIEHTPFFSPKNDYEIRCGWLKKSMIGEKVFYNRAPMLVGKSLSEDVTYVFVKKTNDEFRLAFIFITMQNLDYDYLANAMKSKYGQPIKQNTNIVQNGFGAKFENEALEWRRAGNKIMLEQRYKSIDKLNLMYLNTPLSEYYFQKKKEIEPVPKL